MSEDVVVPLVSFFSSLAATIAFAALVFRPITRRNPRHQGAKIQLADLFSLVVLWQYGLLTAMTLHGGSLKESHHVVLSSLLLVVLSALWLGLATTLSNYGVRSAWRRLVVICLGAPLGIVATPTLLVSTMISLMAAWGGRTRTDVGAAGKVVLSCIIAGIVSRVALGWGMQKPTLDRDD